VVERVAGWSARHRTAAIGGWLALVVTAVALGSVLGGGGPSTYDPGESGRAQRVLDQTDAVTAPRENVLIQARGDTAGFGTDPALRRAAADVVSTLRALPGSATQLHSPLDPQARGLISADGRSALVTFRVGGDPDDAHETVGPVLAGIAAVQARHPDVLIAEAGTASVGRAVDETIDKDFRRAELSALPLTLVILLIVFGALIAAGIPVLLAGTAVFAALGLLDVAGHWLPIGKTAGSVVLLIGMAVGVDYSLFYLRRAREERMAGRDLPTALRITARTSGRAVVVSGLTVMVALAGLFLTGVDVFTGLAAGTIMVVALTVLGSVTVLPALLSGLWRWVDRGRIPWLGRRRTAAGNSRFWTALARVVVRRPLLTGGVAVLALGLLALPAAGMRLGDPNTQNELPRSVPAVDALSRIGAAFPGDPAPAQVVVSGVRPDDPALARAVTALRQQAEASGGLLHEPIEVNPLAGGRVIMVTVPLAGSGTDDTSGRALRVLREQALPTTLGTVPGASYAVTGQTAGQQDFSHALNGRTPLVFGFVLLFAFLLLAVAFRSIAVPLVSIALNLLSIGASYGILTLIFQDGHLAGLLDFQPYGAIVSWLPLFMFTILFGLSMDYHVFILSRIRELRSAGRDTRTAIVEGVGSSAGVVTSAAAIMIAVFAIFATLSVTEYKMAGVGMAMAVLVDATVVRGVLLPAAMSLLGERNWAWPGWLGWLPRLELDGIPEADGPAGPALAPVATGGAGGPAEPDGSAEADGLEPAGSTEPAGELAPAK
jgi:RND superfamily putative drug exporter